MEKNGVRKGGWTKEEDNLLKTCIENYGEGHWHKVPIRAGLNRCRKSCRLRWLNYLRPNLKRGCFAKDEVDLIVRLHKLLGNRWSLIAGRLPGRTANDVKNFWNTNFAKKSLQSTLQKDNIIKPRPRTFSKLHPPMLSNELNKSDVAKEENLNQNPPSLQEEPNSWIKTVESPRSSQPFSLSEEEVDECIRWWGNLLEIAEIGDGSLPFSGEDHNGGPIMQGIISGPANNQSIEDGLSNLSADGDVWGLDNFNLPD